MKEIFYILLFMVSLSTKKVIISINLEIIFLYYKILSIYSDFRKDKVFCNTVSGISQPSSSDYIWLIGKNDLD
ncbi:MAG: hypothetical protein ACTTJH_06710 [Bacteroidales bacterium]